MLWVEFEQFVDSYLHLLHIIYVLVTVLSSLQVSFVIYSNLLGIWNQAFLFNP